MPVSGALHRLGKPQKLLDELRRAGRLDEVREDLAAREAIEVIAGRAVAIPAAQARARDQLWTPEKGAEAESATQGAAAGSTRLWTPSDPRSAS